MTQRYFLYRNIAFLLLFENWTFICRCFPQMKANYIDLAIILKNMLACAKKTFLKNMLCKLKSEEKSLNLLITFPCSIWNNKHLAKITCDTRSNIIAVDAYKRGTPRFECGTRIVWHDLFLTKTGTKVPFSFIACRTFVAPIFLPADSKIKWSIFWYICKADPWFDGEFGLMTDATWWFFVVYRDFCTIHGH